MKKRPSFPVVVPRLPVSVTTVTPTSGIAFVVGYFTRCVDFLRLRCCGLLLFQEKHDLHVGDFESRLVVFSMLPIASAMGIFRAESETFWVRSVFLAS